MASISLYSSAGRGGKKTCDVTKYLDETARLTISFSQVCFTEAVQRERLVWVELLLFLCVCCNYVLGALTSHHLFVVIFTCCRCPQASSLVAAGLALAAAGFAGRYVMQAMKQMEPQVKQALQSFPKNAFGGGYYRGGFEPKMTKREAALVLGVRYV
uniref:DnaJ (Hsp40) homolog, subfamily C, member 19 n=1 Tax=Hippocampus comes TaxID=109280 RepID=A0A3Q3DC10_HIPCM